MATVLITGANRGIGLALAEAYSADGHSVIATARDPGKADALKATGATVVRLDVTSAESVASLKETLGDTPIDILINNAGVGDRGGFENVDYERMAAVVDANCYGPLRVTEALVDNVAASTLKRVASVTSQLGSIENATADWALSYRISKAALNMGMRAAAHKLAEKGITTLVFHPGWVETDMGGKDAPVQPKDSAAGMKRVIEQTPEGKELRFLDWQGETLPW